jgi:D-ribose pyranose/furanose isomerase RbsD
MKLSKIGAQCALILCCLLVVCSCSEQACPAQEAKPSWKEELKTMLPLLGHRNMIVVVDMAYPLQSGNGIKTVYTGESHIDVLRHVCAEIEKAPHIRPIVYLDKEIELVEEKDAAGIDALRREMNQLLPDSKITSMLHDALIARLDETGKMFNVVVLKTNLTVPYTSVFIELDCKYWSAEKERALRTTANKTNQ